MALVSSRHSGPCAPITLIEIFPSSSIENSSSCFFAMALRELSHADLDGLVLIGLLLDDLVALLLHLGHDLLVRVVLVHGLEEALLLDARANLEHVPVADEAVALLRLDDADVVGRLGVDDERGVRELALVAPDLPAVLVALVAHGREDLLQDDEVLDLRLDRREVAHSSSFRVCSRSERRTSAEASRARCFDHSRMALISSCMV